MKRALLALGFIAALLFAAPALAVCPSNACFWIGGTGTMDFATDSAHWSGTSGGTTCSCEPGVNDTITFDGSSGGGTVTANATVNLSGGNFVWGAYTGTLDFSVNNNNVNLGAFNGSGSGSGRQLKMGSGTWTISARSWNMATTTGCTAPCIVSGGSTLVMSAITSSGTFSGGGQSYNIVTFGASTSAAFWSITGSNTFATLNINAPNYISIQVGLTQTVTNSLAISGSSGSEIGFQTFSTGSQTTISSANNGTFTWSSFRDIAFTGGGTFSATNSFNLGDNSGITITAPSTGGGGGHIIGGGL